MKTFAFPNYVNLSVGYSVPILVDEVDGVAIFHVDRENWAPIFMSFGLKSGAWIGFISDSPISWVIGDDSDSCDGDEFVDDFWWSFTAITFL